MIVRQESNIKKRKERKRKRGKYVQVKGGVGDVFNDKAHFTKTLDNVVTLVTEMTLEVNHFFLDELGVKEWHGGFLEGMVGTTVQIATARANTVIEGLVCVTLLFILDWYERANIF